MSIQTVDVLICDMYFVGLLYNLLFYVEVIPEC